MGVALKGQPFSRKNTGVGAVIRRITPTALLDVKPSNGLDVNYTFNRNTVATCIDHEGIARIAKPNELRMERARRVENLFTNTGAPVTQTVTVVTGRQYTISHGGAGTITLSGAATGTVNTQLTVTASTTSLICTLSGVVTNPQVENVTGQTVQTASEYVSNGVLSSPWHGAGVDGVKYFQTKKDGSPLGQKPYFLIEKEETNLIKYSEQFDHGSWTKSNSIVSVPNTEKYKGKYAFLLSNTASLSWKGVHLVSGGVPIVLGSSYCFSIVVKAKSNNWVQIGGSTPCFDGTFVNINLLTGAVGNGNISPVVTDMGGGWYNISITAVSIQSGGNGSFFIASYASDVTSRLGQSPTDVKDMFFIHSAQAEQSNYQSSYIPTTGTAVTRNADVLDYNFGAGNFPQQFCLYAEFMPLFNTISDFQLRLFGSTDSRGPSNQARTYNSTTYDIPNTLPAFDLGGYIPTPTITKMALNYEDLKQNIVVNGAIEKTEVNPAINHSNTGVLNIANWSGDTMPMRLYNLKMYTAPVFRSYHLRQYTLSTGGQQL